MEIKQREIGNMLHLDIEGRVTGLAQVQEFSSIFKNTMASQ